MASSQAPFPHSPDRLGDPCTSPAPVRLNEAGAVHLQALDVGDLPDFAEVSKGLLSACVTTETSHKVQHPLGFGVSAAA